MKGPFDDREEHREAPDPPSHLEVYEQVKGLEVTFGKYSRATMPWGGIELEKGEDMF